MLPRSCTVNAQSENANAPTTAPVEATIPTHAEEVHEPAAGGRDSEEQEARLAKLAAQEALAAAKAELQGSATGGAASDVEVDVGARRPSQVVAGDRLAAVLSQPGVSERMAPRVEDDLVRAGASGICACTWCRCFDTWVCRALDGELVNRACAQLPLSFL